MGAIFGSMSVKHLVEFTKLRFYRLANRGTCSKPKVSVIIATYNRANILCNRTLPAILGQTYKNLEVVVVGDCVADNTTDLIGRIKDKRLIYTNLAKRTVYPKDPVDRWMVAGSVPRNVGLSLATGDWIYTISDDDILLPDCLETMVEFGETSGFESISADFISYVDGKEKVFTVTGDEMTHGLDMTGIPAWMYRSYLSFFKWNLHSWKKKWNRPCDYDLQHRMKNCGVTMGYLPRTVAISPMVEGTRLTGSKAVKYLAGQL